MINMIDILLTALGLYILYIVGRSVSKKTFTYITIASAIVIGMLSK